MGDYQRDFKFITPSQLSFRKLLVNYLKDNELITFFHLIITLALGNVIVLSLTKDIVTYTYIFNVTQTLSIAILSILIAAFGLMAAITDLGFSQLILKMNQLRNFMFPFWLTSVLWFCNIFIAMIGYLILLSKSNIDLILTIIIYVNIYIVTISSGYTLGLIGDILKTTITKVQISLLDDNSKCLDILYHGNTPTDSKVYKPYYKFWWIYILLTSVLIITIPICLIWKNYIVMFIGGLI
jgi:hypothetical protein